MSKLFKIELEFQWSMPYVGSRKTVSSENEVKKMAGNNEAVMLFRKKGIEDYAAFAKQIAQQTDGSVAVVHMLENGRDCFGMIVLQKYFFRSNSSTSLSIFVAAYPYGTGLYLVPSGGNVDPLFPVDYGTEASFRKKVVKILKEQEWTELEGTMPEKRQETRQG